MAYNPNLYNPYGSQQFQPTTQAAGMQFQPTIQPPQPVNGLVKINGIEGAQMYQMPPNSVSPPLMWENEPYFTVKQTDGGGAATYRTFKFQEVDLNPSRSDDIVTRDDFEKFKQEVMEAINGKPVVPESSEQ